MTDAAGSGDWSERTAADVAGLLVELGRVWKAAAYYGARAPRTRSLADRAARAFRSDLARAGPLELEVNGVGFSVDGLSGTHGAEHLGEVAAELSRVGAQRIRFTEVLSVESMAAFAASLCELQERPASQLGIEIDGEICFDLDAAGDSEAGAAETDPTRMGADSLGGALLASRTPAPEASGEAGPPNPQTVESEVVSFAPALGPDEEPADPEKPDADLRPLAALEKQQAEPAGTRLLQSLQALDLASDDESYIQTAAQVADEARLLSAEGQGEAAHSALRVLADHSVGEGGRSGVQARVARTTLVELATGARLHDLIERACSRDTTTSVGAAQILLSLGEHAVPALLDRLESESDSQRGAQLTGLLIALGEATVPALTAAMGSGSARRARLAIQLAGDLQCPGLARPLRDLLCAREGHLHREAARALVEMGNSAALRALLEALDSKHERSAEIAAFSLGTLGAPRSLSALVRRLERATQDRRWNLAREILLAMAQFHEGDRATARALLAWVQRGGPPWRRPDLDLKLEAITTLGQLGGPHTTAALREIAGLRLPPRICERACRILDRRGDGRRSPR